MEFQNIQIDFGALDTFTDPSAIPSGALTTAENVTSQTDGRYSKRFGYDVMSAITYFSVTPSTPVRLGKRNRELMLLDQSSFWLHRDATDTWVGPVRVPNTTVSQTYVQLEQSKDFPAGSRATYGNFTMHAWIDNTDRSVHASLYDNTANVPISSYDDFSADVDVIHTAVFGTKMVVFYSSSSNQFIKYVVCNTSTHSFDSVQTAYSGADVFAGTVGYPHAPFDITPIDTDHIMLAWVTDDPSVKVVSVNVTAHSLGTPALLANEEPDGGFGLAWEPIGEVGVVIYSSTTATAIRVCGFNGGKLSSPGLTFGPSTVEASGGLATNFNCGAMMTDASGHAFLTWDRRVAALLKGNTNWRTITLSGSMGTAVRKYNIYLQSKPFTYNGLVYINVFSPYNTQETYFTLLTDSIYLIPVATHSFRTAYGSGAPIGCLPDIDEPSTGIFAFDSPIAYKFLSNNLPKAGLVSYTVDFTDKRRYLTSELGGSAYFTAGVVFRYSSGAILENNFLVYPEITDATPGAVGGSGMDNGQYSYIVVFETSDLEGNVDRSTTSLPVSVTTVAGAGLGKVTLTIDHLTITNHIFDTEKVVASIFRTEANGETYYCVGSQIVNPNGSNFTFVDSKNDTLILVNRIVYTQGGILDREPAPPAKHIIVHQNRMWGVSSVDAKTVFYSGDYLPGESPWFSSIQQFRIDDGGDIVALASLDEKLVIFKSDRIFKVIGRGGNATGSGNDLTPPAIISSDTGCIEPRSIVKTPDGVMFQTTKGIFLLTRGEEVTYIGKPVSRYLDTYPVVTAATMLSTVFEVRYEVSNVVGDEGATLVYNYRDNRWTTHVNYPSAAPRIDALTLNDVYHACVGTSVYTENSGFRDPSNTYIQSTVETGWIAPAGKQGLVRTQRILFLNELMEDHNLEIEIDKDYVDSSVQSVSYAAADIVALPQEQVSIHLQDQQGEAWRIRLTDSASDGTNSEGFRAKGILLLSGVKRGSFEKNMQAASKG